MAWTRRRFLSSVAAGAAGMSLGARLQAAEQAAERFGEFPLAGVVQQFKADQARAEHRYWSEGRSSYLVTIDRVVRFFAAHQHARGAIIDPYEKTEKQ